MTLSTRYDAVHARLRRKRGRAAEYQCSAPDCSNPASAWAWLRTGPSVTAEHHGKMLTWGVDIQDYSPMCPSHERMLDRGGTLTHCPRGHDRTISGTVDKGYCAECRREDWRSPKRLARLREQYHNRKASS